MFCVCVSTEGNAEAYNCRFPAMIEDWREKWNEGTGSQTTPLYFGFVQVRTLLTQLKPYSPEIQM